MCERGSRGAETPRGVVVENDALEGNEAKLAGAFPYGPPEQLLFSSLRLRMSQCAQFNFPQGG